jgi:hypothetical protein
MKFSTITLLFVFGILEAHPGGKISQSKELLEQVTALQLCILEANKHIMSLEGRKTYIQNQILYLGQEIQTNEVKKMRESFETDLNSCNKMIGGFSKERERIISNVVRLLN